MPTVRISKVVTLAEQLASGIRSSGLKAGDSYMNAAEVAKELRVSASMANRVLQILAECGIVERAQKRGTIISNPNPEHPVNAIKRVHMITFQDTVKQSGLMADPVIVGMQRKLPGVMIQFNFLPPMGNPDHLARLLDEARRSSDQVGIVLTKAPAHAQRMVAESGIAAVIHGYPQAGVENLPSITTDYDESGRLAGRFCVDSHGERTVLVLPNRPILEGDYRLMTGIQAEMASAGYKADSVVIRCFDVDGWDAFDWMREFVKSNKGKTVFLLHPDFISGHPTGAIDKALPIRSRSEVIVIDEHDHVHVRLKKLMHRIHTPINESDVGERIAEMLATQGDDAGAGDRCEILPVKLVEM
jgi:DNA-binding LacI/PurR family transcriptional regulator